MNKIEIWPPATLEQRRLVIENACVGIEATKTETKTRKNHFLI